MVIILLVVSCANVERSPAPENLFDEDKIVEVLVDLYVLEAAVSSNKNNFEKMGLKPTAFIYKKYATDSVELQQNLNYYVDRTQKYEIILEKVKERIEVLKDSVSRRQERIDSKNASIKVTKDSIQKELPEKRREEEQ